MEDHLANRNRHVTASETPGGKPKPPAYPIESVDSALRLLQMIAIRNHLRVREAATGLGVAPSTAHRLLAMLQYYGFVTQDCRRHGYTVNPDFLRFGLTARLQVSLREQARPILEELARTVKETVHVGVLGGANVTYVDCVEGAAASGVGNRTAISIPLHCVSIGKALLAALPKEIVDVLYPSESLPRVKTHTISTKTELLKELAAVNRNGFATSNCESDDGIVSAATAVFDQLGDVRAAISIAVPASRATQGLLNSWIPPLRKAATELGTRLSFP